MVPLALVSGLLVLSTMIAPASSAAQLLNAPPGRITRFDITRLESPTFDGRSFGRVGQYEKLVGRAYGEVDPKDPRNAVIIDLSLAPTNANGMVEYSTDVYILRPIDPTQSNHRLFFEINNRGNNLSF